MPWDYDSEFTCTPEGIYRCRIDSAREKTSRAGSEMIEMKMFLFGAGQMFYYLVHDYEHPDQVNKKYRQVFKSFSLPEGTDVSEWGGAMGFAYVRNRTSKFDGSDEAYIAYFVSPEHVPESVAMPPATRESPEDFNPISMSDYSEADMPI